MKSSEINFYLALIMFGLGFSSWVNDGNYTLVFSLAGFINMLSYIMLRIKENKVLRKS